MEHVRDTDHDWGELSKVHPRLRNLDQERSLLFHATAVSGTGPARVAKWVLTVSRMAEWMQRNHGDPNPRSPDPSERSLGYWLARQRRNRHTLCGYQLARLSALDIDLAPRTTTRRRYAADIAAFRGREGRLPSRKSTVTDERRLGEWIHRQRKADRPSHEECEAGACGRDGRSIVRNTRPNTAGAWGHCVTAISLLSRVRIPRTLGTPDQSPRE